MNVEKDLTVKVAFDLAIQNHQNNNLQDAHNYYNKVLEIDPKHLSANINLGTIFQELGENQKAKECYEKAIEINPNYADAHNNLGTIFQELGKNQKAKECYEQAIAINPNYADAHNNLGTIFQELGKNQKAKECYEKAIELNPNYVNAHHNLGIIFKKLAENQKAKECYEKAIELNTNHVDSHSNLGNIFKELGENQKAKDCYEKAIEINPNYADAHYNLGIIFKKLAENKKAKECYEKAIKLNPNHSAAHNNLGNIFKELGENQKAIGCYEKAIKINPNSQEALINRGKILFNKGEFELSLIDFDNCNNFDSRSWALTSLYALGHIDEIYKRIEENSQLDEKNISVSAFSSFIANKEKKSTAHNFCPNPINFIHHSNLSSHLKNFNSFIMEIIKELHGVNILWEPFGKTTIKGFQSKSGLFRKPQKKIQNLKSIIISEIESYYLKFKNENCSFIKKWPSKYNLAAWHVILKKQGHQNPHIHASGWLSGVIYLKVVPSFKKNEGAIEFSLNGSQYYDAKSPKVLHAPKAGDIVLFPSSLHHRTIPFSTDTDRISIAFDLIPNLKKEL
jgi:tetratricopeptide (TPR) repeat protein